MSAPKILCPTKCLSLLGTTSVEELFCLMSGCCLLHTANQSKNKLGKALPILCATCLPVASQNCESTVKQIWCLNTKNLAFFVVIFLQDTSLKTTIFCSKVKCRSPAWRARHLGTWWDWAAHHVCQVYPPPRLQPTHTGQWYNADQTESTCHSE